MAGARARQPLTPRGERASERRLSSGALAGLQPPPLSARQGRLHAESRGRTRSRSGLTRLRSPKQRAPGELAGSRLHREATRAPRSTPRRRSPRAALFVEEPRRRVLSPACAPQRGIHARVARSSQPDEASFRERDETSGNRSICRPMSGGCEFRDDLATVSHQNSVTRSHLSDVLAQAVFQLANAHRLHSPNVAPGSYIIKRTVHRSEIATREGTAASEPAYELRVNS